jgi:peptidoglycan biosynthesis protein MviN/MurJ (putative lipid II flippase)
MLPRMVSYPIDPVQTAYFASLALTFGPGSASALTFADDYRAVPVILIAQQFSLALFPSLSAADADGDRRGFRSLLSRNIAAIGVLTLIAAVLLAVLAPALIGFLLRGGAFDAEDVALTASLLAAFAVSVPLDGLTYPLSRGLYATHNTGPPGDRLDRRFVRSSRSPSPGRARWGSSRSRRLRGRLGCQGRAARGLPDVAAAARRGGRAGRATASS